ncbi:DUF4266 domain-containing protein [Nitrosomonas sp. sh817]|jgi:hypothetical protein|uniref:DUF4266 domain-containing protein n=1 Tax=unclassified Nitrosomonas TaxID=2609265 RepID=UPI0027DB3B4D|nr:DUF4266 domain-containing protein [Nitrosomonas sp. sh817]WMJ07496.1 DUF4266 domain-containing protein [Nitrosomonas sp. sh817]
MLRRIRKDIVQNTASILFIVMSVSLTGCAHVSAWERGNLAKSQMDVDPFPLQSEIQAHNYSSREAAPSHKSSSGGGGCGCY